MRDDAPLTPASEVLLRRLGSTDALRQELADIEAAAVERAMDALVERIARQLYAVDDVPWAASPDATRDLYRHDARRVLGLLEDGVADPGPRVSPGAG